MRIILLHFSLIAVLISGKITAQEDTCNFCEIVVVNGDFDDYSPVLTDSATLIFTSARRNPLSGKAVANFHNMYMASLSGNEWTEPKLLKYLNNSDNNEASVGFSGGDQTLYIYKTFNGGDIYSSSKKANGKWGGPRKMSFNTPYHESSASRCDSTVYFVSDKPGGKGEHDLYATSLENGVWSEPVNLSILNTDQDEYHVSNSTDCKTIYFSSKGHNGLGGFDVFKSEKAENGNWGTPINMGDTINTEHNEVSFLLDAQATICFASDRPSENDCGYNIYYRSLAKPEVEQAKHIKVPLLFFDIAPIEEAGIGKILQVKDSVEIYGFERDFPKYVVADISVVADSSNILYVKDIILNDKIKIVDDENTPLLTIKMLPKAMKTLTLEEVKKAIDFDIEYCKVQVGTFFYLRSLRDFNERFPLLEDRIMMISSPAQSRFLMKETYSDLDSAAVLQRICMIEYESVPDTFIDVYDASGRRIIIYFDVKSEKYMILKPKDQTIDIDTED